VFFSLRFTPKTSFAKLFTKFSQVEIALIGSSLIGRGKTVKYQALTLAPSNGSSPTVDPVLP